MKALVIGVVAPTLRESLLIVDSMRDGQVDRRAVWLERFGRDKQSIVCMEECAELIQAVSKRLRGRPDPEHNLAEEMADVTICLKLLQIMYDITDDELDEWVERKTMRQKQRMEQ